jgi:hypothetical protein
MGGRVVRMKDQLSRTGALVLFLWWRGYGLHELPNDTNDTNTAKCFVKSLAVFV